MNMVEKFFLSLAFFTRLPIPEPWQGKKDLASSIYYFPLAGLVVGLLTLLAAILAEGATGQQLGFVVAFLMPILLSGGLHLDGLADSADGLFYAGTRSRRLEIMRDTQLGVYGVLALGIDLLIRFYATERIWFHSDHIWLVALVPFVGKVGILYMLGFGESPKEASLSADLANNNSTTPALAWSVVVLALWMCPTMHWSLVFFGLTVFYISVWAYKKVGCACGDLCGFVNEAWELIFLLALISSF